MSFQHWLTEQGPLATDCDPRFPTDVYGITNTDDDDRNVFVTTLGGCFGYIEAGEALLYGDHGTWHIKAGQWFTTVDGIGISPA